MGGPIAAPPPFPSVIPRPISSFTTSFLVSAFQLIDQHDVRIFVANPLRVGDRILLSGFRTLTTLNNQSGTIQADVGTTGISVFNPTAATITVHSAAAFTGTQFVVGRMTDEVGVVTLLTSGPSQPPLFFTDPWDYSPPSDGSGPLIVTKSVMSVEHPGRAIADTMIGTMTRIARFTLTPQQLLNLHSKLVQVLPEPEFTASGRQGTPGHGLAYVINRVHLKMVAGTHPYSTTDGLNLYYGPPENEIGELIGDEDDIVQILASNKDTVHLDLQLADIERQQSTLIENQPINVKADTAITGGNGYLTMIIEYTVLQL